MAIYLSNLTILSVTFFIDDSQLYENFEVIIILTNVFFNNL